MRFYETTFFCDKDHPPLVTASTEGCTPAWPFTIRINMEGDFFSQGSVTLHLHDERQLIQFKNSIIQSFESMQRRKHG